MTLRARLQGPLLWTLSVVTLLALMFGVGRLVPEQPYLALLVAVVVLMLGLTLADPTVIPLLAMPVLLVVVRVSAGGIALSVSDVVLFVAFWPAVVLGAAALQPADAQPALAHGRLPGVHALHRRGEPVHRQRRRVVPRLVPHRWRADRRVGPRPGRSGRGRADAAAGRVMRHRRGHHRAGGRRTCRPSTRSTPSCRSRCTRTSPARVLCFAALVAYVHPPWMRWPRWLALAAFVLCTGGDALHPVATGHRRARRLRRRRRASDGRDPAPLQAARPRRRRRRSRSWRPWSATRSTPGNQFNSVFQRINWFQDSIDVWLNDPIFGVGLRWWYTDRFPAKFQPPNAELEVLTTTGVVGLLAFLVVAMSAPSSCSGGSTRCTARSGRSSC